MNENKIVKIIEESLPAIISIAATKKVTDVQEELTKAGMDPKQFAERLANESENGQITVSAGSAFIVDTSGLVLTNKHVIQDKDSTFGAIIDGKKYNIEIIDKDPLADIAILKIINASTNLHTIPLGSAKKIKLGQGVIAIGNALGEFQNTVSVGIVSGLSRFLSALTDLDGHHERLRGLIQTDAAINPGNSGGPLINLDGEVIGINTAVVFGAQNIGFAIPIDRAKRDLEEIKQAGHIRSPFLGIRYVLVNKKIAEHFKLSINQGALIVREGLPGDHAVLPGSAADIAGLREHDIIVVANNQEITDKNTLEDVLDNCAVGDELELKILRNGENIITKVPLEDRTKFA
ncbi:MAG: trypsin-like peptidase domain-containing protein [Patescibacteria group bacterium]